jgi:hypothetical protein
MLYATILNLTRFFHEYYLNFYQNFHNKLFYYLVINSYAIFVCEIL